MCARDRHGKRWKVCLQTQLGNAEWEDVPRVQDARPSSPEMFDMDTEHDNAASNGPPAAIRLPPGLNIKPAVPAVQPFNMFAQQQVSTKLSTGSCCACHGYSYNKSGSFLTTCGVELHVSTLLAVIPGSTLRYACLSCVLLPSPSP